MATTRNEHTGDSIKTKVTTDEKYEDNFTTVFRGTVDKLCERCEEAGHCKGYAAHICNKKACGS